MSVDRRPAPVPLLERDEPGAWAAGGARLPGLAAFAIQALILGSLFTGLPGPTALGELRGEGALIGVPLILLFAALSGTLLDSRAIKAALLFLPLAGCILFSFAVNAEDIQRAHFLGREGPEKFLSSLLVLTFYLSAFYAIHSIAVVYGAEPVLLCASRAAILAGFLLCAVMAVEAITWLSPPLREIWGSLRGLWTSSSAAPVGRLVGFAPEPSFASITALGLVGLMLAGAALQREAGMATRVSFVAALVLGLLALQLLANSRTFLAGALGFGFTWLLLVPLGRSLPAWVKAALILLAPLVVQAAIVWSVMESAAAARSTSNVTRTVGMITAAELWTRHPLVGLGLGQYGFHFRPLVPSWGLESWEISRFFRADQYALLGGLPPSFSLFTRIGAELGLCGFLAWCLPPFLAIRSALKRRPGPTTTVLICALTAQIWTGLSLDSFRNIYYWMFLAFLFASSVYWRFSSEQWNENVYESDRDV